jgi:hypothetical protein
MAKLAPAQVVGAALEAQTDTDISVLAAELLTAFGGPAKLAAAYKQEFDHGKDGGMARQRMLEGVLRAVSQASAQAKDQQRPVENLSEAELQENLLAILTRRGLVSTENAGNGSGPVSARAA